MAGNGKFINIATITIYGLIDSDGVVNYIGVTSRNPKNRLSNHIYESKKTPNKTKKTKWISSKDFKIKQIIIDEVPKNDWKFWESYWIEQFKTWGFDLKNSNNGGGGSLTKSKEFSKWLSERNKGNKYRLGKKHTEATKKNIRDKITGSVGPNKCKVFSDEWKNKISEAKKGKPSHRKGVKLSEETLNKKRKKITQMTKDGTIIKIWDSLTEAANSLSISCGHISNVCNGVRITTGGFKWEYYGG